MESHRSIPITVIAMHTVAVVELKSNRLSAPAHGLATGINGVDRIRKK